MVGKAGRKRNARREAALRLSTALLALAAAAAVPLLSSQAQAQQAFQDPTVLERGRYLVETAAFCGLCHTTRGVEGRLLPGMELAGGRILAERGFRAVAPNITPNPETGIGRWSDAGIAAAIRNGQRPDSSLIGPPMPVEFYRGISDRDLGAMVAYLRTVPPVRHAMV